MAVVYAPESEYAKEMRKWEDLGAAARRRNDQYPRMLYRAQPRPDGRVSVGESDDRLFGGVPGAAENFSKGCQLIVNDESEYRKALERGYRPGPQEALEFHEARERAIARAAAERSYADARMSPAAQAEAAVVDEATDEHVPEIPRKQPRRRASA